MIKFSVDQILPIVDLKPNKLLMTTCNFVEKNVFKK